jgi:CPA2 family monovalent cation:H+ antiporter-2
MQEFNVLVTLAGALGAALTLGFAAYRLGMSPIVGYLLAGVVVGPFTPGFVADRAVAERFAEIGVILLLFGIGLRFQLRELFAVWRVAVPGALIQSALSTTALAGLLRLLGFDWTAGVILGLSISVASTVVMARVLADRRDLHSPIGHLALGWTVVEDLITVALLLVLPILFVAGGGARQGPAEALGLATLKLAGLVCLVALLGRWAIPWALERIARTRSHELFTLAVLVLAFGLAVGASGLFGVSMALGAFLVGLAVGRSEFAARAAWDAVPMRDAFSVLFFVSAGMLFDPRSLLEAPGVSLAVLGVVLVGKPILALGVCRLLGRPLTTALPVGAALGQVGEFSFILGALALQLGLIQAAGWNALVAAAIVSIALNPSLYQGARGLAARLGRSAPEPAPSTPDPKPLTCILVGFGPIGQIVHDLLAPRGARLTIIELNLDTVRRLRAEGLAALYGDVLRPGTLEEAGIARASSLILSADVEDAAEIVRRARALNPALRILVRCTHLREVAGLQRAGATLVAAGEAEVAVALAEAVTTAGEADPIAQEKQRSALRERLYGRGENP